MVNKGKAGQEAAARGERIVVSGKVLGADRETKGERTRRRIIAEARAMIEEMAIEAISQDAVARRAGITQSALRHHFQTKDDLFEALFDDVFSGFYRSAERVLLEPGMDPRQRLMKLCALHLGYILTESDRVALESFAHYLRQPDLLARQSSWYHWIVDHYTTLLGAMRNDLDAPALQSRALAILTLCIGAWITNGRSRPPRPGQPRAETNAALLAAIEHLADH